MEYQAVLQPSRVFRRNQSLLNEEKVLHKGRYHSPIPFR